MSPELPKGSPMREATYVAALEAFPPMPPPGFSRADQTGRVTRLVARPHARLEDPRHGLHLGQRTLLSRHPTPPLRRQ